MTKTKQMDTPHSYKNYYKKYYELTAPFFFFLPPSFPWKSSSLLLNVATVSVSYSLTIMMTSGPVIQISRTQSPSDSTR